MKRQPCEAPLARHFLAHAPFIVGGLAARVGAWFAGGLGGSVVGWLALVARQLWLARLPTDGLAWWVVVGRQAGEQPGLLLGPANYPIPSQQIAQPLFWTANLSSAGASVLPQAQPEMHLIFPRRCQSKAPLSDHTPGFAHECVAKPPCNYVKCQATLFGGRLITSTTKPKCLAPSLFCWQSSPGPPARARNAITPTRAHSFHTALPGLGLCQPPVVASPCSSCPMAPRCVPLAYQVRWATTCSA